MDIVEIKKIFGLVDVSKEIIDKINRIEAAGFTLDNSFSVKLSTRNNIVGSHGAFNEMAYYDMKGREYKVATFKNEKNEKRYCILDDNEKLINIPFSRLLYNSYPGLDPGIVKFNEAMVNAFKEYGIEIKEEANFLTFNNDMFIQCEAIRPFLKDKYKDINPDEIFESEIPLEEIFDISAAAKELVKDIILNLEYSIENLQEIQKNNNTYSMWSGNKNGMIILDEIHSGMERQYQASQLLCDFIYEGRNSSEQNYMTTVLFETMSQVASLMIDKGILLNAETARTFNVSEKALNALIKKVQDNPEKSKDLLNQYMQHTLISYNHPAAITGVHYSIINVLDNIIKNEPEKLNYKRINGDLQTISHKLYETLKKCTPLSTKTIQKLNERIMSDYMKGDAEKGMSYNDLLYAITVKTKPLHIEDLELLYDTLNAYLDDDKKLPNQLITKLIKEKTNNLSVKLQNILSDDSLSDGEKLKKCFDEVNNFAQKELKTNYGPKNEDFDYAQTAICDEECLKPYAFNPDFKADKYLLDIPEFKQLQEMQAAILKEINTLANEKLMEESPYIYKESKQAGGHEKTKIVTLSNGLQVDLFKLNSCKTRYEATIEKERQSLTAEMTETNYTVGKIDGYYPRTDYTVQIGNRALTFGFADWTNNGKYTRFFENNKGFGVSSVDSEWARYQCSATQEQINEIINLGLKYPNEFWELFDRISQRTDSCGVYPMTSNFANMLRDQINEKWENIEFSLDTIIDNGTALPTDATDIDDQIKNKETNNHLH